MLLGLETLERYILHRSSLTCEEVWSVAEPP